MTKDSLRYRRERALGSGAELFYDEPLEICLLYTSDAADDPTLV